MILPANLRTAIAFGWRLSVLSVVAAAVGLILTMPADRFGVSEPLTGLTRSQVEQAVAGSPVLGDSEFRAVAMRPLFYPTRKPWVPPPIPEPPPPAPTPVATPPPLTSYTLVGVVISGNVRSALVKGEANKVVTLSEGQEIDGWTLQSITPERLLFRTGDTMFELTGRKPFEIQ